jgi:phosphopantetheinyl transferase (holo-ACP synthase)
MKEAYMEMDTSVLDLFTGQQCMFEGILYCLNVQCGVPIISIDLTHNMSCLNNLPWSKLLSLAEVDSFQQGVNNIEDLPVERLAGRLAAKLAMISLTGKKFNQIDILTTKSIEHKGQPYSSCGRYISISHSGQYVMACAANFAIGIDIQKTKHFSKAAINLAFKAKEIDEKFATHTLIWAIKESFLKALGLGIFPYIQHIEIKKENQHFLIETSSPYIEKNRVQHGSNIQIITGSIPQYSYSLSTIE